ncbi:MAG: glycosyltransferase family 4 protein [Rhodospirillales bacterium]
MTQTTPHIAFFVTEDWFFLSHRLGIARACREQGWQVTVSCRINNCREKLEHESFRLAPLFVKRGSINPITEVRTLINIYSVLRRHKPDILHLVGLKMILYGSIAALLFPRIVVVNAVSGLGTLFTGKQSGKAWLRWTIMRVLRRLLRRRQSWVIVQNRDDEELFRALAPAGQTVRIPGVGVNISQFSPAPEPGEPVIAALVARMIGEKGIPETIEAARKLRSRGVPIRIRLVGAPDPENPSNVPEEQLLRWRDEGLVVWNGRSDDIAGVWRASHIVLLPSHREGFPKSLIEGMACARPVVTTDVIGCRDVIEDGVSGFLVPKDDPDAIAAALQKLAEDRDLRLRMGAAARKRVENLFSDSAIINQTLATFTDAMDHRPDRPDEPPKGDTTLQR